MLDQLSSGVAVFDASRRLTFYNDSYRRLWDFDRAFLDDNPDDLQRARQAPGRAQDSEQPDFRAWKNKLFEAYRAIEPAKDTWYLPDGRALSVVTTPNPEGGVTYLFDDVTESLKLARQNDGLIRVQRETLDNLAEAVAVFGSNGRAQLFNPPFARMWKLSPVGAGAAQPHIETIEQWCRPLFDDDATWRTLRAAITGIDDRISVSLKLERKDGSVLDCTTMPLPDGATMLTFQDVTDTVNVERALRERNEALEAADQMKIDFVHHMSYELRAPLTSIIGFAHFLGDPSTGPMTPKQSEYLSYITTSTDALLAISNNILDLATIDAGAMKLNLGPVDLRKTVEEATAGIQDRLARENIRLDVDIDPAIGDFVADERRIVQVPLSTCLPTRSASRRRTAWWDCAPGAAPATWCSQCPTAVPAFPKRSRTRCSTGSKAMPTARAIAAPDWACRWFGHSSNCMAARSMSTRWSARGTTVTCEFPVDQSYRMPLNERSPDISGGAGE